MAKRFWTRSLVSMENYVMQHRNVSDYWQTDLLESAREDIAEELSATISKTEDSMKTRLDEMATAYAKKTDEIRANYTKVLNRIGVPVPLPGESTSGGQSAELDSVSVFGFDRTAFSSKIEAESRSLERLWGEWEKVQQKIICLAVEVLGVKRAGITKDLKKKVMKKRLNRAAALFEKQQSEQGAMRVELQKQHQAITLLTENSIKQLKARQKVLYIFYLLFPLATGVTNDYHLLKIEICGPEKEATRGSLPTCKKDAGTSLTGLHVRSMFLFSTV